MSSRKIREATSEDCALILHFINALAVYEKLAEEVETDEAMIADTLFASNPKAHCLICEVEGEPAGFAIYFYNYSTWKGKYGIYLEDLFVSPEFRGKGAGKALLIHIAGIAINNDCARFEWSVLDWNTPSIDFYKSLGAKAMDGWDIYRVDGENLKTLANSG
jgi:GNAT superfamily N-acetyltransferase